MCGLAGVLLAPVERSAEDWKEILEIATANLTFNEKRGREASGVAVIQRDGQHTLFKQPVVASDLVNMPGYQATIAAIDDNTVCILGHTRAPTKGSRWNNANNHPIHSEHIIGIHNGHIKNDDSLFDRLGLPRAGEVDSEIIFRLLNTVDPMGVNGQYPTLLRKKVLLLEGTFSTLSIDLRNPTGLLALKHLRPLCVHYEPRWEALFFSSRYIFLRKAFGRSVITEALDSGYGFYFDARHLPEQGNKPDFTFEIVPPPKLHRIRKRSS
jgi:glucosamine 6-phosphate synthetase-like amidotransferase/phosphosugar isomerase protein